MRLLILLLAVALGAVFLFRATGAPVGRPAARPSARSARGFAFLSNGNIFVRERGGEVLQLHSDYVQEALDRRERARTRNAWKQGTSFKVAAGGSFRDFDPADAPIVATSATYEANGDLLYFLRDSHMGCLFRREAASGKELRLLSRQHLHLSDLAPSPDGMRVAAASFNSDQSANIALLKTDGSGYQEATGGDTVDSGPAWVPGEPKHLVFQSTGIARHENGSVAARGHSSILQLDMDSGKVVTVLEDPRYDFLRPRVDPAGNLLFIRRPHASSAHSAANLVTDTLFFPFRLLRAVFHYLNFFSLMYSRKPLTSASGPAVQADLKQILLQGRRIDAEKALRSAGAVQGIASLVPDTWVLVRRSRRAEEEVLATNVASFDVCADGTIVYSNGQGVFVLASDGSSALAASGELVAEVVAAPA